MVPVKLRLKNFLSYGTEAPPLDFSQFQVACLSGRNGQGKSALLDAMTWALWGEARKSSGSRKPDDDLIRIGTRHMRVEFVFDVEGERYRVTRSYQRSATGKTTTSDLEFHLYEPEAGRYRPLTGSTQRETQTNIENTLGLDYDTFINSAFLLQGRSDEFTKKRPSQRKEILSRILDLSRYQQLARLARRHWRDAKEEERRAEDEIERLEKALEGAPAWKKERTDVRKALEEKEKQLEGLREEEKKLTEALADLEAKAREATSLEKALADLEERIKEHQEEAQTLRERIEKAETLLAKEEEIKRDHDRYEALLEERNELDTKRDLCRGIERQIERRRSELKDRKNELERRLERLEVERKADRKALEECTAELAKEPALRQALKGARKAKEQRDDLAEVRERREALQKEMAEARQALEGKHRALEGQLQTLQEQIQETEEELSAFEKLEAREKKLLKKREQASALEERCDAVREEGQQLSEAVKERKGKLSARREKLAELEEQLAQLQSTEDGQCPTCGTELTEEHRLEVEREYEADIEALRREIGKSERALRKKKEKREQLRSTYSELREKLRGLQDVPEELATVREQLRAQEEQRKALEKQRARAKQLCQKIEKKAFGQEARASWKTCKEELDALSFDGETFEELQNRAAQVKHYEERLHELEEKAGRKEQLEKSIESKEKKAAALREKLDNGEAFGDLQEQIKGLEKQLADVDFEAERFQEVKEQLDALSGAGARLKDLMHAQQNQADWKEQLERTEARIKDAQAEVKARSEKLEALRKELETKDELESRQQAKAEECAEVESALSTLQQKLGELNRRLEEAERDRTLLDEQKQELKEAKAKRNLYKQLRKAFGKHGIPSLIIEQTLPEIEERANALLERLTDGRMHVRLETLKDKKTGGTKETLEIIITDEQGIPRAYETFSGGEAFRVNFALRIALAQLLAERNGVRIRTLVIDEGFGTQDQEGLQNLVEAIRVIQEDFDKIIVITHLEELKQVFPVRIEVEKDPVEGSSFEMLGT